MSEIIKGQKRVLVISGGGSRGAWGGGLIKALYEREEPDYACITGNSTGSLLAPLVAINDFEKMERGFTEVTQEGIFNVNPFDGDGNINMLRAIRRVLCRKKNLGESKNLKSRIAEFFTLDDYNRLKASGRTVVATVVSLTTSQVISKSSDEYGFEDMRDWIWASANQPILMSTCEKENQKWVDGGIKENVPITSGLKYAMDDGIKHIDLVVNNVEGFKPTLWPKDGEKDNVIHKLLRIIDIFSDEVRNSDIDVGVLRAKASDMTITPYYMTAEEFDLSPKSLMFEPAILKQLWKRGYAHDFDKLPMEYTLPGNNIVKMR